MNSSLSPPEDNHFDDSAAKHLTDALKVCVNSTLIKIQRAFEFFHMTIPLILGGFSAQRPGPQSQQVQQCSRGIPRSNVR